jgi:hypothetical protein
MSKRLYLAKINRLPDDDPEIVGYGFVASAKPLPVPGPVRPRSVQHFSITGAKVFGVTGVSTLDFVGEFADADEFQTLIENAVDLDRAAPRDIDDEDAA